MQADKARGIRQLRRHPRDRDGAGVGGKDRIGRKNLACLFKDARLDVLALGRRLDDKGRLVHGGHVGCGGDAPESRIGFFLSKLFLGDQPAQTLGDGVLAATRDVEIHVGQEDVKVARGGLLGDAAAHLAGTDDRDRSTHAPLLLPGDKGLGHSRDHCQC